MLIAHERKVRTVNDGAGPAARFNQPQGLAVDGTGNVYVADTANGTIRKITPDGLVSTLAGTAGLSGSADGAGCAIGTLERRDRGMDRQPGRQGQGGQQAGSPS